MKCNLCGCSEFVDMKSRKGVRCRNCSSLERTRLLWMYLQEMDVFRRGRVLHLAPEMGIYRAIKARKVSGEYVCADLSPERYSFAEGMVRIDLCNLDQQPPMQYDLILHSHVMEHIPCNIAYTLFHLHRMMTLDGVHLCVIPFMPGRYDECFGDIGDAERTRRFGQWDHVRRFGSEDVGAHLGKVMRMPDHFDATEQFSPEELCEANVPAHLWRGFHAATVLKFARDDMLMLRG